MYIINKKVYIKLQTLTTTQILMYDYQIAIMKLFKRPFLVQKADKLNSKEN